MCSPVPLVLSSLYMCALSLMCRQFVRCCTTVYFIVCFSLLSSRPASKASLAAYTLCFGTSLVLSLRSLSALPGVLEVPVWLLLVFSGLILLCHYYSPAYSPLVLVTTAARLVTTAVIVSHPCLWSGLFTSPTTSCHLSTVCQ